MEIHNNIGFSYHTGALFVTDMPGYGQDGTKDYVAAPPLDLTAWQWSPWGGPSNNLLPMEIAKYIETCGILSAICNLISITTVGKGLQPFLLTNIGEDGSEEVKWLNDTEILDWIEDNDLFSKAADWAFDKAAYGWKVGTFILNKNRDKINRVIRKDVYDVRLEKKPIEGANADVIGNIFLSSNWDKVGYNPDTNKLTGAWVIKIPALLEGKEIEDLKSRKTGYEFAFIDRPRRNGRQYYPLPLWWSALEWVKQAIEIPKQKNAIFKNSLLLRYVININKRFWEDKITNWSSLTTEQQQTKIEETYDNIDQWLSGTDNQGKSLFAGTFIEPGINEPLPYVTVTSIDDKFKDGKLLPDATAANVEILMACLVNPSFLGAGSVGGQSHGSQSGGSNIRESIAQAIMNAELYRKEIVNVMQMVAEFNGWNKKYNNGNQRLVWRFQSSLLTTLDTGKSTKTENL